MYDKKNVYTTIKIDIFGFLMAPFWHMNKITLFYLNYIKDIEVQKANLKFWHANSWPFETWNLLKISNINIEYNLYFYQGIPISIQRCWHSQTPLLRGTVVFIVKLLKFWFLHRKERSIPDSKRRRIRGNTNNSSPRPTTRSLVQHLTLGLTHIRPVRME